MARIEEGSSMLPDEGTSAGPPKKRRQVKNACTKCQKASKGCDDSRPCRRCVRYGFGIEECVDSPRKERKKGAKRGPYKKRNAIGFAVIPLPGVATEESAIGFAYSTFYAGPNDPTPTTQTSQDACYPTYYPQSIMEPLHNPLAIPQPTFPVAPPPNIHAFNPYGLPYMKPPAPPQLLPPPPVDYTLLDNGESVRDGQIH
ncbi:Zn(2)-C6 fungal-type domain-containing protein [Mycena indigotica]|uniref:Transcription activator of gluconeogenesis ERT1 n=1 Tax=Mycena indigotica TaxID=2126181 RepID=A0A8H6SAJ8_9AGAR|nr:Zn(2)-C6 fungal-type domain-containing protein [Mycena indigotica]KAF7295166.1 Zn(2)-C6 fungal-type domain-containing protein [Mycena indigotica]